MYNILYMSTNDGKIYLDNKKSKEEQLLHNIGLIEGMSNKNKEMKLFNNLGIIEGFSTVSRSIQKKNPSKFFIPQGSDPGQMVLCRTDKTRYIKLYQSKNFLQIQEVEVYDETGKNVALSGPYSNKYEVTQGLCRKPTNEGYGVGTPGSIGHGNLTLEQCQDKCGSECSAYEIQSEGSTEGSAPGCYTYYDPVVTGNGDPDVMCRVKQRVEGTPVATMSSYFKGTNPFLAINGNTSDNQPWPNSACTQSNAGGWWELDLGKDVNVKKIIIYNRPDCCQERLNGTTIELKDREQKTLFSKILNSDRKQIIDVKLPKQQCGGPVVEKNMDDFFELKQLRNEYNEQLKNYNQSVKNLLDNSHKYISASNKSNNKFANTYVTDGASGQVGYVNTRGVWKYIPNPDTGDSMQGMGQCPSNWRGSTKATKTGNQLRSIGQAEEGEIVNMSGQNLIKGTSVVVDQNCSGAGTNAYVVEPATPSSVPKYQGCMTGNPGEIQSDLANISFEGCRQRAADKGSNTFMFGKQNGTTGTAPCYLNGTASSAQNDVQYCYSTGQNPRFGGEIPGYTTKHKSKFGRTHHTWHPPVPTFSKYTTTGANNSLLNKSYHITDDLQARNIPEGELFKRGSKGSVGKYQVLNGYGSKGNDIKSGSANDISDVKSMCDETDGCAGFSFKPSTGQYWLKNSNMWPSGNRHKVTNGTQLYVRAPELNLNSNCNSSDINFVSQNEMWSSDFSRKSQYSQGPPMSKSTLCGLGIISDRDNKLINDEYKKLQAILLKIKNKIQILSRDDVKLNSHLNKEYDMLQGRLKKYEDTYEQIGRENNLIIEDGALKDDFELNMLSNNKKYIIWSIIALGITLGLTKVLK